MNFLRAFRFNQPSRVWAYLGLLVVSISFVRCKPIAPSVLKGRYLRDASKAQNSSSTADQVNLTTKTFDDRRTFETELEKTNETHRLVISERVRSDALSELKNNGFAEIHADFAPKETLTALVRVELSEDDQALTMGEAKVLASNFSLELKSLGHSTWVLAVSPQVGSRASVWNRARIVEVILVAESKIQLPDAVVIE